MALGSHRLVHKAAEDPQKLEIENVGRHLMESEFVTDKAHDAILGEQSHVECVVEDDMTMFQLCEQH